MHKSPHWAAVVESVGKEDVAIVQRLNSVQLEHSMVRMLLDGDLIENLHYTQYGSASYLLPTSKLLYKVDASDTMQMTFIVPEVKSSKSKKRKQ